jgi:alpha-L-rhamnosidase
MKIKAAAAILLFVTAANGLFAQQPYAPTLYNNWKAFWIHVPGEPPADYGVYLFRKKLPLASRPSTFRIHVSADNRYKLYVNEKLVSLGPARGDVEHWNYETVEIAPFLLSGDNVIAAQVWNEARWRPEAQISFATGLIVQGASDNEQTINTNDSWKCVRDSSYTPIPFSATGTYYVAGPGELVSMSLHPANWMTNNYNDEAWKNAEAFLQGNPKSIMGPFGIPVGWLLVPSNIPQMEMTVQRLAEVRMSNGIKLPAGFPAQKVAIKIPSNTTASFLLDQKVLTNAYPTLIFSGGKNAGISLQYAETLYTMHPAKGNRNDVDGKQFIGRKDSIISDGGTAQQFTPLNWRTYRYMLINISTKEEPLVIDDLYGTFTGYPFKYNSTFESDNEFMKQVLETGWRTARLCAVETYMDCPYYEQLQYIADARIQALVSLYNSGDDRLIKNAITLMDHSRRVEGVTESRHPSYSPQFIPTFSLWYIGMLHDYWMYGKDTTFIKDKFAGARQVLNFFRGYQQSDGSLLNVPYWMFTDWVEAKDWRDGTAPYGADGTSAINDLQLLYAYQKAADFEKKSGMKEYADMYTKYILQLKSLIKKKYWAPGRQLFADRGEKDLFSQHANALAILTGVVTGSEAASIAEKLLSDKTLAPASIYFKYYLHLALIKAGFGNDYLTWLDAWRDNLKMGLTTWGEQPDINTTRSDCHAWGASPNIEFYRTILGIDSDAPGFRRVKIEPHPGNLTKLSGSVPHPYGNVSAEYTKKDGRWHVNIQLPAGITGTLVWQGKSQKLMEGSNSFTF